MLLSITKQQALATINDHIVYCLFTEEEQIQLLMLALSEDK